MLEKESVSAVPAVVVDELKQRLFHVAREHARLVFSLSRAQKSAQDLTVSVGQSAERLAQLKAFIERHSTDEIIGETLAAVEARANAEAKEEEEDECEALPSKPMRMRPKGPGLLD